MSQKIDTRIFRLKNNLKQQELAAYLGVTAGFLSQIEQGKKSMPDEMVKKITNNPHGWDVSMLTGEGSSQIIAGNGNGGDAVVNIGRGVAKPSADTTRVAVLEKENEMLRERLKDKEAQIEFLRELVRK